MSLGQSAWGESRVGRLVELLEEHRPKPGEDDLRGFEWFYWHRLTNTALLTLKGHGSAFFAWLLVRTASDWLRPATMAP